MTILYGFTKDDGFAMVDTDARCYLYGYPTSDIQVLAKRAGALKAALARIDGLANHAALVLRLREVSGETNAEGSYQRVFESMVAPQVLFDSLA